MKNTKRLDYSWKKLSDYYFNQEIDFTSCKLNKDTLFRRFYDYEKNEIESMIKTFNHLLKNTDIIEIKKDMIWSKYIFKANYEDYFMLNFMRKNDNEKSEYITNGYRHRYFNYLNELFYQKFYSDKFKTYRKYKNFYKRDMILIKNGGEYNKFKAFLDRHEIAIKKPYNRSLGIGIEIINKSELSKDLFKKLVKESGKFVLEELIQQSDIMNSLHPESVNTIRIYGYIDDKTNKIIPCFPFIKMGVGSSIVDNGGSGGIFAAIDGTGTVVTDGIDELCNKYEFHPNTKIKIKGFKLPDRDGAINTVKLVSSQNKHTRLVGWDLAHTNDGWVIVEGNGKGHFLWQIAMQKGMKKDFEKLIHRDSVKDKEKYGFKSRK